jgi:hypothetical protein
VIVLSVCYKPDMVLKSELVAYQARWNALEEIQKEECLTASLELCRKQFKAAYGMAKGLGLLQPDPSEAGVFARWAKLKEKTVKQPPKP